MTTLSTQQDLIMGLVNINNAIGKQTPDNLSANTLITSTITAFDGPSSKQASVLPSSEDSATVSATESVPAKQSPLPLASHVAGVTMREQAIARAVSITGLVGEYQHLNAMSYEEFSACILQNAKSCCRFL